MKGIEPTKPVNPVSNTKDSTYRQKSQRGAAGKEESFREMIKKIAVKKDGEAVQTKKAPRTDTVTISEEGRKQYEKMKKEREGR